MKRRDVIKAIFGVTFVCPKWLEKLLLEKHPTQIKETERYDASARKIVERVLEGCDIIDTLVDAQLYSCGCVNDSYFRGLYNGLLLAQATLQDSEYKPI
jgi:hypothetical protein